MPPASPGLRRPRPRRAPPAHARRPRLRGADARSSGRRSRPCWPAATCWPRRRPGTGKTAAFALPDAPAARTRLTRIARPAPGDGRGTADGTGRRPRRSSSCPPASWRCRSPRPSTATAASSASASCRSTAASRSASSCAACGAASTSSSPRPGRAVDHLSAAASASTRCEVVVLDEADEMLDMGFAEDLDAILVGPPPDRQTALFSATISPAHRPHRRGATCASRSGSRSRPRRRGRRRACPRPPGRLRRPAGRQARRAGAHPRRGGPRRRPRLRPDARRGGRPGRGAERARPRRGGAPRRPVAGAARPGHGPLPRRLRSTSSWPPTWPPAGLDIEHVSHVVNYDVPSIAGRVRPPHRPDGARRPRGGGDHPRRAARAPAAAQHRGGDEDAARDRRPADGRRPARAPASSCSGRACARRSSRTATSATAASSSRSPTSST